MGGWTRCHYWMQIIYRLDRVGSIEDDLKAPSEKSRDTQSRNELIIPSCPLPSCGTLHLPHCTSVWIEFCGVNVTPRKNPTHRVFLFVYKIGETSDITWYCCWCITLHSKNVQHNQKESYKFSHRRYVSLYFVARIPDGMDESIVLEQIYLVVEALDGKSIF